MTVVVWLSVNIDVVVASAAGVQGCIPSQLLCMSEFQRCIETYLRETVIIGIGSVELALLQKTELASAPSLPFTADVTCQSVVK
jgi:hypothetical protein